MGAIVHDAAQHARRILSAVNQGARGVASDVVAHSWARCLNVYRLDPSKPRRPPVLSHAELSAHHDRMCTRQHADPSCGRHAQHAGTDRRR